MLHRACTEYCNMAHENSKECQGHLPWLSANLEKYEKLTLLDALEMQVFYI